LNRDHVNGPRYLLLIAAAIAIASCRNPTEAPVAPSGSLSFDYSGAATGLTGRYAANGAMPGTYDNPNGSSSWAYGTFTGSGTAGAIISGVPKNPQLSVWDEVFIAGTLRTPGPRPVTLNCAPPTNCAGFELWLGRPRNGGVFQWHCFLTEGTMNVTAVTETSVAGTFSGIGACYPPGDPVGSGQAITFANGLFDVTIKPD
jgi:hypothetical protein